MTSRSKSPFGGCKAPLKPEIDKFQTEAAVETAAGAASTSPARSKGLFDVPESNLE